MIKILTRQTKTPKGGELKANWYVIDAKDQILGRLSTKVADLLMGKGKPHFTPGQDSGDHVVILNAKNVAVTGRKEFDKIFYRHSGYPGGLKGDSLSKLRGTNPERIIEKTVKGMLPKSRLGAVLFKKMHVVSGTEHSFSGKELTEVKVD